MKIDISDLVVPPAKPAMRFSAAQVAAAARAAKAREDQAIVARANEALARDREILAGFQRALARLERAVAAEKAAILALDRAEDRGFDAPILRERMEDRGWAVLSAARRAEKAAGRVTEVSQGAFQAGAWALVRKINRVLAPLAQRLATEPTARWRAFEADRALEAEVDRVFATAAGDAVREAAARDALLLEGISVARIAEKAAGARRPGKSKERPENPVWGPIRLQAGGR